MSHIKTASGKRWHILDPRPELVDVEDIAHALSMQCRFNGHCRQFYSVAQHAVVVAREVYRATSDIELAFWGLHHDDEEAYLGDIVRPLKRLETMSRFREVAKRTQDAIAQALGFPSEEPAIVKQIDSRVLATEQRDLMSPWADASPPSYDGEPYEHLAFGDPSWGVPLDGLRLGLPAVRSSARSVAAHYIEVLDARRAEQCFLDYHYRMLEERHR
jgi:hypothetical protein